jgi:hypothetical protein
MAIKTFTTGEVLTAADTNTYLANSGLVYVAGGALSTATTNFSSCFTSTYTNYRVIIDSPSCSATADIYIKYLTGTTTPTTAANYYWAFTGLTSGGVASNNSANAQTVGYTGWSAPGAGGTGGISIDFFQPNLASNTMANINTSLLGTGVYISRVGQLAWDATTVFTGFQITSGGASTLGGNVSIYGYRKA